MAPKRIYVFGWPYGDSAGMPDDPFYTNQVYDPEKDSWVAGAGIPTSRCMFGVAVVNDQFYVIGGFTETFDIFWNSDVTLYAANEQYTPFGYGTPDPSYDGTAPGISVLSPENKNYYTADARLNFSDVALDFTVDEPVFRCIMCLTAGFLLRFLGTRPSANWRLACITYRFLGLMLRATWAPQKRYASLLRSLSLFLLCLWRLLLSPRWL
jgi:hypothetical protein